MLEIINFVIAISSGILAVSAFYTLHRIKKAVSTAFGMIGKRGAEMKHKNEHIAEIEGIIKEGSIEILGQKYPELSLLYGWLKDNHPEVLDWIGDDPMILFQLYEKYKPLIDKFLGKQPEQQQVMYDT